jgi:ParB family chromosome partitioning protein
MLLENGLTERHARALLKVESLAEQKAIIRDIIKNNLNVSEAEKKIAGDIESKNTGKRKTKKPIIKDMRIVLNTIREALKILKKSGIKPVVTEKIEDNYLEVKIVLSKEMLKKKK